MATKEQYKKGAKNLTQRVREASTLAEKARVMTCLGNLRYSEYQATQESQALRLAGNCYLAARSFHYRQLTA